MILSLKQRKWLRRFAAASLFWIAWLGFASVASAATATPISVSSTSVAGSTVTVTTTAAHGLAVNQGFCNHSFTTPYCGVVAAVPTSTTFTYAQSGVTACATACGSVVPAKEVIILDTPQSGTGVDAHYLCWSTTQQPVSRAGATSLWTGAAGEENTAIAAGIVIENSRFLPVPTGTTLAQAQALMVTDCKQLQAALAGGVQPGQFYGDFFDTGWLQ